MSYEKVKTDFQWLNEKISQLGENDKYGFYAAESRIIVHFKKDKNPFDYNNEFKGKLIDNLINVNTVIDDIYCATSGYAIHRTESGQQTEEYAVFTDLVFYGSYRSEIIYEGFEVKSNSTSIISLLDVLDDINKTNDSIGKGLVYSEDYIDDGKERKLVDKASQEDEDDWETQQLIEMGR